MSELASNRSETPASAELSLEKCAGGGAVLNFQGDWRLKPGLPKVEDWIAELEEAQVEEIEFSFDRVEAWDSAVLPVVLGVFRWAEGRSVRVKEETLPSGLGKLVGLALAVPEKEGERKEHTGWFRKVGDWSLALRDDVDGWFGFVGRVSAAMTALVRGKGRIRRRDFMAVVEEVGPSALPIVALISFLIGLVIAFLGSVVLVRFGASYYVSYLVGYGMLREMGAVMTAVILAGRTSAAFAAQIGSMKVSEEIDALKVLGIDEVEYLVIPRLLAMFIMMPILVIFANIIGILGGVLVSTTMLDMAFPMFQRGLLEAVSLNDLWLGLAKGVVFGQIVAVSGCIRGLQCGTTASAVGKAATSAVVTAITLIVASNTLIDWIAALYGI